MIFDNQTYSTIDAYLKGQLSGKDLLDFKNLLETNPDLKQEVLMVELANEVVIDNSLSDVKSQLADIHNANKGSKGFLPYIIGVVGGFTLLLGGYFLQNQDTVTEDIITDTSIEQPKESDLSPADLVDSENPELQKDEIVILGDETLKNEQKVSSEVEVLESKEASISIETKSSSSSKKSVVVTKKEVKTVKAVSCDEVQISANLIIENTCEGEANGKVVLEKSTLSGGTSPYEFALISSSRSLKKKDIPFANRNEYKGLKQGFYSVFIRDSNGCISYSPKAAKVNSSSCQLDEGDVFSKVQEDNTWKIHTNVEKSGRIQILDSTGNVYFTKEFSVGEDVFWNGLNDTGDYLDTGVYNFVILYSDGHKVSAPIELK